MRKHRSAIGRCSENDRLCIWHARPQLLMTARVDFHFMQCAQQMEANLSDETNRHFYDHHSLAAEINFEDGGRHCLYSDGARRGHERRDGEPHEQNVVVMSHMRDDTVASEPLGFCDDDGRGQYVTELRHWLHQQIFDANLEDLMTPRQRHAAVADILAGIALRMAKTQREAAG